MGMISTLVLHLPSWLRESHTTQCLRERGHYTVWEHKVHLLGLKGEMASLQESLGRKEEG